MISENDNALLATFMDAQAEPTGAMFSENVLRGLKAVLRFYAPMSNHRDIAAICELDGCCMLRDKPQPQGERK